MFNSLKAARLRCLHSTNGGCVGLVEVLVRAGTKGRRLAYSLEGYSRPKTLISDYSPAVGPLPELLPLFHSFLGSQTNMHWVLLPVSERDELCRGTGIDITDTPLTICIEFASLVPMALFMWRA